MGGEGARGGHTEVDKREAEGADKRSDTPGVADDDMRFAARLFNPFLLVLFSLCGLLQALFDSVARLFAHVRTGVT